MKLVEDGKLDLDAAVRSYLPDFRVTDQDASQTVTIRHLMPHTGGRLLFGRIHKK
jgi:CubicO group peptidase (beta-lactamase class C family)